jgi:hypothetical protein
MNKISHGEMSFSLTYGSEAMIRADIGIPSSHFLNVNTLNNDEGLRQNLDALEVRWELAATKEAKHKNKKERPYNNFFYTCVHKRGMCAVKQPSQ